MAPAVVVQGVHNNVDRVPLVRLQFEHPYPWVPDLCCLGMIIRAVLELKKKKGMC